MEIKEVSVQPTHFPVGKSNCTITYKATANVGGNGSETIILNEGSNTHFLMNNSPTNSLGPSVINYDANEKSYTVNAVIEVTAKSNTVQAFNIEVIAKNIEGREASKRKSLTRD